MLTAVRAAAAPVMPPAGTIITNKATARFIDSTVGYEVTVESNPVNVVVNAVEDLKLVDPRIVQYGPGTPVNLPHQLTNTGNTPSQYHIEIANLSGDSYDLQNVRLIHDLNGNGVYDSGEPEISPTDTFSLKPGESMNLVIAGTIPITVALGDFALVEIKATTTLQSITKTNVDRIEVNGGVAMRLNKSVSAATAEKDDFLTYTLDALSVGAGAPQPVSVTVDGSSQSMVIIRDEIPANTEFDDFVDASLVPVSPHSMKLYHLRTQTNKHTYVTSYINKSDVDAVALGIPSWHPDSNHLQARLVFRAKVLSNTLPHIDNTGEVTYADSANPGAFTVPSNTVRTTLKGQPPTIYYYTDNTFTNKATSTGLGSDLYLEIDAASCNKNPNEPETKTITIVSQLTGDTETITIKEIGPNTGIFRPVTPVPTEENSTATPGDGVIQTLARDHLHATIKDCAGQTASTIIVVNPYGVVFDSRTNIAVPGVIVTVKDLNNNTVAGPVTTGADGVFSFPNLPEGTYLLEVVAPPGYSSPSNVPSNLLPLDRIIDSNGSYLKQFTIPPNGALAFDVPLDSGPPSGLFLEKKVSNSIVEVGDYVQYSLRLKNSTGVAMNNTQITDYLPTGFALVPGSVRFKYTNMPGDDDTVYRVGPDPVGSPGPVLTFRLADMWPFGGANPNSPVPGGPSNPPATGVPDDGGLPSATLPPGTLTVGGEITITYRVRVGVAANSGNADNRAKGEGDSAYGHTESNVGSARVLVQRGVLNTRGIIIGKVFVDTNKNGVQDKGEDGIPGVRIWVENGNFAVTDSEGKYSIYGLSPGTHVVKLDTATMPRGSKLSAFDYNHAGSGSTSFVDLRMGGMVKANFAIVDPTESILENIAERRKTAAEKGSALDAQYNKQLEQSITRTINTDRRGQAASGTINNSATAAAKMTLDSVPSAGIANTTITNGGLSNQQSSNKSALGGLGTSVLSGSVSGMYGSSDSGLSFSESTLSGALGASSAADGKGGPRLSLGGIPTGESLHGSAVAMPDLLPLGAGNSNLPQAPVRLLPQVSLEEDIRGADNSLAFLNLRDGDVLPISQSNISIKGAAGAVIKLLVNGEEVPESRIGKKITNPDSQLEARQYIGVALQPGQNTLELKQSDMAGNSRGDLKINVVAPGKLGGLKIYTTQKVLYADGRSDVNVHVKLTDDKGVPVTVRTPLTLEASAGEWDVRDVNPLEPGVQVFLEGGEGIYPLRAPIQSGDSIVRVSSGVLGASMRLSFLPELRPLVAAGIVEMRLGNFRVKNGNNESFLFDEQLRSLSGSDKSSLEGRAAMFLKGRVKGEYLLTMRYDTQRDEEDERLFRDIQPDEYYPIYGDSSLRGYDAQSTSRLYVRIDKNRSYVLYGDFTTPQQNLASSLGSYNRSLTGGKLHHQTKRFIFDAFASHDSAKQVVDEVPANGTSGPYLLASGGDVVRQSEKVELITRDRNQPSVILKVEPLTRFSDYTVDGLTRGILFRSPVPSRDADLNPIFIRVTYESDRGGPRFFVGGLSGQFRASSRLILGGTYAQADDPLDPFKLGSINAQYRIGRNTLVVAEAARSDLRSEGKGGAERIEILHEDAKLQARAMLAHSDENFSNPSSLLSKGQKQAALRASYRLNANQRLLGEAIYTKDAISGSDRQGVALSWEQSLTRGVRLLLGARHIKDTGNTVIGKDVNFTSLRARLAGQFSHVPLSLFTEYERAISGDGQTLTLGGDYQFSNRSRLYFRHRLVDTLAGLDALDDGLRNHATVVGMDTAYMKNGRVFSEYRINDAIDGRSAEAAIGLRNLWTLSRAVRVGTSFERVKNLSGGSSENTNYNSAGVGTAGAVALEYLPRDNFKATARVEARHSDRENSYLGTAGLAYKINRNWSLLTRGIISKRDSRSITGSGGVDADGFDLWNGTQTRLQIGAAWRQTDTDAWNALMKYEYVTNTNDAGSIFTAFKQRAHIVSLDANKQLNPRTDLGLHYAWKYTIADGSGISSSGSAQLISGRVTHDFKNRKMQASLLAGLLKDGRAGSGLQSGLAAEIGYRIKRDMTLGVGYSLLETRDSDLGLDFTKRGPYLRWRWKFDENLFHSPGNNSEQVLASQGRGVQLIPAALQQAIPNPAVDEDNDSILSDEQVEKLGLDSAVGE